jgi:hypothetical protein
MTTAWLSLITTRFLAVVQQANATLVAVYRRLPLTVDQKHMLILTFLVTLPVFWIAVLGIFLVTAIM